MRQLIEYSRMALANIVGNKMRSLLTMLGIIIGISAVIVVLSIGSGGQKSIEDQLSGIANGSVYIYAYGNDSTVSDWFTDEDIAAIESIPGVAGATSMDGAYVDVRGARGETLGAVITGGNANMNVVVPHILLSGRMWDAADYDAGRMVCTIDSAGAKELFGSDNVVGMTMEVSTGGKVSEITIVGVTQSQNVSMGTVQPEITMPASSLDNIVTFDFAPYIQLALIGEDPAESYNLAVQARTMLELRHNNAGRNIYEILDTGAYMEQFNEVIGLFTTIIAAIAGISLLVGGIGVMNIMLVSVTERTREIGIRKALGAKTRTILFQFLIESATLTLLGGLIGILLGSLGGRALGGAFGIDASISVSMMLTIALFSSVIGIFFGIYPARKAARLNPIEALRSD